MIRQCVSESSFMCISVRSAPASTLCAVLLWSLLLPIAGAANRFELTASSSSVTAGTSFTLTVAPYTDSTPDTAFVLSTSTVVTPTSPTLMYRITGDLAIEVTVLRTLDNAPLTLSVADQGASGSLSLTVAVVATGLQLPDISPAVPGTAYTLSVTGVDDNGNTDTDFVLDANAYLRVETALTSASISVSQAQNQIEVTLREVLGDKNFVALRFYSRFEGTTLSGLWEPVIDVEADRLLLAMESDSVTLGASSSLQIFQEDTFGNRDTDPLLDADSLQLVVSASGMLSYTTSTPIVSPVLIVYPFTVQEALDGAELSFAVSGLAGGRQLTGMTSATVLVEASELRLSGPLLFSFDVPFTLNVRGTDGLGHEDLDYEISNAFSLEGMLGSGAGLTLNSERTDTRELRVTVSPPQVALSDQLVTFTLSDGVLSGSATSTLAIDVVRWVLSASSPVVDPSNFTLTAQALNALGHVVTNFAFSSSVTVTVTATGEPEVIVSQRQGVNLSVQVRNVADKSTLELTVADEGLLPESIIVTVEVVATQLGFPGAPDTAVPGVSARIDIAGVDSVGNVDADFQLSPQAAAHADSASLELVANRIGTESAFMVELRKVLLDNSFVGVRFESGALSGRWEPLVAVAGSHLEVHVTDENELGVPVVRPAVTGSSLLLIQAADDFGNIDSSYRLDTEATIFSVVATAGELTYVNVSLLLGAAEHLAEYGLRVTEALDGDELTFTITDPTANLMGTSTALVTVVAERLRVLVPSTPAVLVHSTPFTVEVLGEDLLGNLDLDYALSVMPTASATPGQVTPLSYTASTVQLSLFGFAGFQTVTLTLSDGSLSGSTALEVQGTIPDQLYLRASSSTVVVGQVFSLEVSVLDDQGTVLTVGSLDLSNAQLTLPGSGAGLTVERQSVSGDTLMLVLRGANLSNLDNSTVLLDMSIAVDGVSVSGTTSLTALVVADGLSLSGPTQAVADTAFTLVVRGVDGGGNLDEDFALSASPDVVVSIGTGRVSALVRLSDSALQVVLSDHATATASLQLTVSDQGFSELFSLLAIGTEGGEVNLDLTSDVVDIIDATLLFRGIRLTKSQRDSIVGGQTSNIVAAGYQNLLASEVDIVNQIEALLSTDPPALDLTGDNVVDIIDATLLFRGIRLTKSQRASLISGEMSNIVVAGYTNLLESEVAIVAQISRLLGE